MKRVCYLLERLQPYAEKLEFFDMHGIPRTFTYILQKAYEETEYCSEVLPTPGIEKVYINRKGLFIRERGKKHQVLHIKCKRWKKIPMINM